MTVHASVPAQGAWQGRGREVSPIVRQKLEAIEVAETEILRAQDDVERSQGAIKKGIVAAVGGALGVAGLGTLMALTGAQWAFPHAITAGVFVLSGIVVAHGERSELRKAREAVLEKKLSLEKLTQELTDSCAQDRAVNDQSLLKAGNDNLALMRHLAVDPFVHAAESQYAHASKVVTRDKAVLAMTRADRFAALSPRAQAIANDRADLLGLFGLLGMVGTAWTGMAVTVEAASPAAMLGFLALAGCEWLVLRKFGHKMIRPSVDKQLTRELKAEVAWHEPRLDALREGRDRSQKSALDHYVALLNGTTQPTPGTVRVEDQRVVIGGVSVPRSKEE